MRHQTAIFFLGALLVAGLVQGTLMSHIALIDEEVWLKRVTLFAADIWQQPASFEQRYYGGQPGMSFVTWAGLLHTGGLSAKQSLVIVLVVFNAVVLAAIYTLLYQLRPTMYWWLANGSLLLHPYYLKSTPTNILMAPLAVLLFLLALKIYESRPQHWWPYLALGASIGFGLANRFTDTLLFAAGIAVCLFPLKKKHAGLVMGSALVSACIFDPLFLTEPIAHTVFIMGRVAVHYNAVLPGIPLHWSHISLLSPFLLVAVFFGLLFLFSPPAVPSPVSKKLLTIMLLISGIMVASIMVAKAASARYLYPVVFLWEVFLPLFLLQVSLQSQFLKNVPQRQLKMMLLITFLVVGGQLLLIRINL